MPRHESSLLQRPEGPPIDFSIENYINFRILGFSPRHAALQSGYKSHKDYMKFEKDPYVVERLEGKLKEMSREALYTRDKVMEVIEEGIDMARIQADPTSMIRAAQEINKMQGYYAPETKEVTVHVEHEIRRRQISEMDESDLLEALGHDQPYIDAEFETLPEEI